jgi:hypothetical protein
MISLEVLYYMAQLINRVVVAAATVVVENEQVVPLWSLMTHRSL